MKKILSLVLALAMLLSATAFATAEEAVDNRPRTIITSDFEIDDLDSFIHLLLYANELDIDGMIYSASTFHWNGDGVHTLEETGIHHKVNGLRKLFDLGDDVKEWSPMDIGWLENLLIGPYAEAYDNLIKHDPRYPTPGELVGITKIGNIDFEGDMRFETEGSNYIKKCILDDDPRTLYLQVWGGANTVARALLSIEEQYSGTEEWDVIREKVNKKIVLICCGDQDLCYEDYIAVKWPDVLKLNCTGGYGYFTATQTANPYHTMFGGEWMKENIKFGHGPLNGHYYLYGDGQYLVGENDFKQFGLVENLEEDVLTNSRGITPAPYNRYDFISEGDSPCFMYLLPNGLRGLEDRNYGSWGGRPTAPGENHSEYNYFTGKMDSSFSLIRWVNTYQNDWAARADWCVTSSYEDANHQPVVALEQQDFECAPGTVLNLNCIASDPDGDELSYFWQIYSDISTYKGAYPIAVRAMEDGKAIFAVPEDAADGDMISIVVEVTDDGEPALTRYAQAIVRVTAPAPEAE